MNNIQIYQQLRQPVEHSSVKIAFMKIIPVAIALLVVMVLVRWGL